MATPKQKTFTSIVGLFMHTLEDGFAQYQGHIIGTDGDMVLVQLFSFLDGGPTCVEAFPKADMFDPKKVRLYASADLMNEGYVKLEAKRAHR